MAPRTTRKDRKSNGKEVRHQGDKKETYIQTSRRGGDGHWGGEDSRCHGGTETGGVWDKRVGQSDHKQTLWPYIRAQINREGRLRVVEKGAGRAEGSTPGRILAHR